MHEASLYSANRFLTLTYAPEHLPAHGSLDKKAVPLFLKRLRKRTDDTVRYFQCGEYGENFARPHYHVCLLNYGFPDEILSGTSGDHDLRTSELLADLWPFGHHQIGDLTFNSAAYVARYVTKKINGRMAEDHYSRVNPLTGEIIELQPEFATMSRRPGIGKPWFDKYWRDVYPSDEVISRGHPSKPPRYYDQLLERTDPDMWDRVRKARADNQDKENQTTDRLAVREECVNARTNLHQTRTYETGNLRGS